MSPDCRRDAEDRVPAVPPRPLVTGPRRGGAKAGAGAHLVPPGRGTHGRSAFAVTQAECAVLRPRPVHSHPQAPASGAGPVGPGTRGRTAWPPSPPAAGPWGGRRAHARPRSPGRPRPGAGPCGLHGCHEINSPERTGRVGEPMRPKHGTGRMTVGHAASQQSHAGRGWGRAGVRAGPSACAPPRGGWAGPQRASPR